jgi:hypothetical protein
MVQPLPMLGAHVYGRSHQGGPQSWSTVPSVCYCAQEPVFGREVAILRSAQWRFTDLVIAMGTAAGQ